MSDIEWLIPKGAEMHLKLGGENCDWAIWYRNRSDKLGCNAIIRRNLRMLPMARVEACEAVAAGVLKNEPELVYRPSLLRPLAMVELLLRHCEIAFEDIFDKYGKPLDLCEELAGALEKMRPDAYKQFLSFEDECRALVEFKKERMRPVTIGPPPIKLF